MQIGRHLRESLRAIDTAAAAGLKLKELRSANLRGEFGSYLQEALLADHFLTRGHSVSKGRAGNGRNPDLEVATTDFTATVEVYSPRSWQWWRDWLDDVVDTLRYAYVPYAYGATVDVVVHGNPVPTELLEEMICANTLAARVSALSAVRRRPRFLPQPSTNFCLYGSRRDQGDRLTMVEVRGAKARNHRAQPMTAKTTLTSENLLAVESFREAAGPRTFTAVTLRCGCNNCRKPASLFGAGGT